jgi:hypothetical protein
MSENKTIIAYKGFDKNLQCRNFQYKIGETYTEKFSKVCEKGFHACTDPMDVWSYYSLCNENRYCLVECSGTFDFAKNEDSKFSCSTIKIIKELTLKEILEIISQNIIKDANSSSGYYANNSSSDDYANNSSSGDCSKNASSGDCSKNASSGNYSKNASSGDCSNNASSGDCSNNASSGDCSNNASSGNYSKNASSGDYSNNEANGKNSVIACAGNNSKAKGVKGTWISLAKYNKNGLCSGFVSGCIGKNGLKENVWYTVKNGKLVQYIN